MNKEELENWYSNIEQELKQNIIPFWLDKAVDEQKGGFYGRITNNNQVKKDAPKGLILNARILWTFSNWYRNLGKEKHKDMAKRAFEYIKSNFIDKKYGGAFWLLDSEGNPIDDVKKMYGQAFVIYAMSEYYLATETEEAKEIAIEFFNLIENNNYDQENGGYYEASKRDWEVYEKMQLSDKDMAEAKSMNNHLHILEGYTNLYRIWQDNKLEKRLKELIQEFLEYIIDSNTYHLRLFFNAKWVSKSKEVSFGHDIETSWLLCEAAEVLGDEKIVNRVEKIAINMTEVTLNEAIQENGAIYYEQKEDGSMVKEMHWWPQMEAVVGLMNTYQITGIDKFLTYSKKCWEFIKNYIVDKENGEWFYKVDENGEPVFAKDKVSEWKTPYHNGRGCIEMMNRINKISK